MNIVVFDFDDTLYPSSYLVNNKDAKEDFTLLASSITKLLNRFNKAGYKIYIVSNATTDWVYSRLDHLNIKTRDLSVVSARYITDNYSDWKTYAFMAQFNKHFSDSYRTHHLVSFGDCPYDRDASLHVGDVYRNVVVKNVSMMQQPTFTTIIEQHNFIYENSDWLCNHTRNLDLSLIKNLS